MKALTLTGKYHFITIFLFIVIAVIACSQSDRKEASVEIEQLFPEVVADRVLDRAIEDYDRETIFKYMNGAGEIYRLYDYKRLYVRRYLSEKHPIITVELFDMGTPEDAYGIFSHSRESENTGIGRGYEYRGGLLCFYKNKYFVCISAEEITAENETVIFDIAGKIAVRINDDGNLPDILKYLPEDELNRSGIRYFHKHTSLNCHYYLSENNILNLSPETEAVLARYGTGQMYLLIAEYDNHTSAKNALFSFKADYLPEAGISDIMQVEQNKWVGVSAYERFVVIVFDALDAKQAENLIEKVIVKINIQDINRGK